MNKKGVKLYQAVDVLGGLFFIALGIFVIWFVGTSALDTVEHQLEDARSPYQAKHFLAQLAKTPVTVTGETKTFASYASEFVALRTARGDAVRALAIAEELTNTIQDMDADVSIRVQSFLASTPTSEHILLYGEKEKKEVQWMAMPHEQAGNQKQYLNISISYDENYFGGRLNE